jgi:hypothetical protein
MRESPFAGTGASSDRAGVACWSVRWFLSLCIVIAAVGCSSLFADSTREKNVLVLHSFTVRESDDEIALRFNRILV